jgi:hypothetical protein
VCFRAVLSRTLSGGDNLRTTFTSPSQVLSMFDSDLDFAKSRVRLWQPGTVSELAAQDGLVEVPAAVLNESGGVWTSSVVFGVWACVGGEVEPDASETGISQTSTSCKQHPDMTSAAQHAHAGVWGIRCTSPGAASPQPFVGIVDCGASFSAVNWAAARLLGLLDARGDLKGPRGPDVISLGACECWGRVDGREALCWAWRVATGWNLRVLPFMPALACMPYGICILQVWTAAHCPTPQLASRSPTRVREAVAWPRWQCQCTHSAALRGVSSQHP